MSNFTFSDYNKTIINNFNECMIYYKIIDRLYRSKTLTFVLLSLLPILLNLFMFYIWIRDVQKIINLALSWYLILMKMSAENFQLFICFISTTASQVLIHLNTDEMNCNAGLVSAFWLIQILFSCCIPANACFMMKINLIVNVERYILLKYPLKYRTYFTNKKMTLCLILFFSIWLFRIIAVVTSIITLNDPFGYTVDPSDLLRYTVITSWFLDIIVIMVGFVLNVLAYRQIAYSNKTHLKKARTILFLFGPTLICLFTIVPLDITSIYLVFVMDSIDRRHYYNVINAIAFAGYIGQSILYPATSTVHLLITNPILKSCFLKRLPDFRKIIIRLTSRSFRL